MVSKKASRSASSKVSSKSALATSSATYTPNKSSVLRSLFSPPRYQLSLFASVIQGPESQLIRIHDTITGRLKCKHAIKSKANITCLDWGNDRRIAYNDRHQGSSKKRKRDRQVNGYGPETGGRVVLAFGTSDSDINMFSVTEGDIIGSLKGAHTQGIKDFKFSEGGKCLEGWSLGGDAKLVQWDIEKRTTIRSLPIASPSANALCPFGSDVIYASHVAVLLDPIHGQQKTFTASNNPVQIVISSSRDSSEPKSFITAAESDRYLTVFETDKSELVGTLRTESQIQSLCLTTVNGIFGDPHQDQTNLNELQPDQILLAVNKEGILEIFPSPFKFGDSRLSKNSETIKSRMKQRTKTAAGFVKVIRPDKLSTTVPLLDASFEGDNIVMAWAEGGVGLMFDRIRWRDEVSGKLLITGVREIAKPKNAVGFGATTMNGAKDVGRSYVDESQAIVVNGGDAGGQQKILDDQEAIDNSSDIENREHEEDDTIDATKLPIARNEDVDLKDAPIENEAMTEMKDQTALEAEDTPMNDESKEVEKLQELSFGDLLKANAPEQIEVQTVTPRERQTLVPTNERDLNLPSGMSLGAVLTQSLRTNDVNLLETCLHVKNLGIVRATVERLESSLATSLLQRLAERLYSRPGRAGRLMVWIQWTLVAHGGYLVNQPEVMKKLASLHRVVKERANSLQPLLSLKGKLDMLEAQMNLRKGMQARSKATHVAIEDSDEGAIYVEGQEESDSEIEKEGQVSPKQASASRAHQDGDPDPQIEVDDEDEEEDEEEDDDEVSTATSNHVLQEASEATDSEEDGFLDDEASSTSESSDDDAISSEATDDDSLNSGMNTSSEPESPPPKRLAKSKLSNGLVSRRS